MQPNKIVQVVTLFVTLTAGIVKIVGELSNTVTPVIVNVLLAIGLIYFLSLLLQWLGNRFISAFGETISLKLSSRLETILEPLIERSLNPLGEEISINPLHNLGGIEESNPSTSLENRVYGYTASRYGVGYKFMDIDFVIHKDGSATITRTITIEAFSEIDRLDTYLLIPERSESGESRVIDSPKVESLTGDRIVDFTEKKSSDTQQLSALLTISPALKSGEIMQYRMIESLPVGLYAINCSPEEYNARTKKSDYAGWNVSRPSKELSLKVHFPEFFKPTVFSSEVRYASASIFPAERIQHEEKNRLTPKLSLSPQGDHYIFRLDVEFPMTGLIYILSWQPIVVQGDSTSTTTAQTLAASITTESLSTLHKLLVTRFSESELKTLCFNLALDYDALPGEGNIDKSRELIAHFKRREQISELLKAGKKMREDVDWSTIKS
ncbi:MAG: hypothetical protein IPM53_23700 [Anaerolineaceae bacterium]|nr:hypothetical protein [Anaerolineaceae bacterium]